MPTSARPRWKWRWPASPLYARFRAEGNAALDGNIGGAADLMLYALSYLQHRAANGPGQLRQDPPQPPSAGPSATPVDGGAKPCCKTAAPLSSDKGGLYVYPIAALVAVNGPAFTGELDRLGIRHGPLITHCLIC